MTQDSHLLGSASELNQGTSPTELIVNLSSGDPPFSGSVVPIVKDTDPESVKPRVANFFKSQQFKLWEDGALEKYNKLLEFLYLWQGQGWANFTEARSFIDKHENWLVWVQYTTTKMVPVEDLKTLLERKAYNAYK